MRTLFQICWVREISQWTCWYEPGHVSVQLGQLYITLVWHPDWRESSR